MDKFAYEIIEIPTSFFEHLLNCLANQKFIDELDDPSRKVNQKIIDDAWNDGMAILNEKSFVPRSDVLTNLVGEHYG